MRLHALFVLHTVDGEETARRRREMAGLTMTMQWMPRRPHGERRMGQQKKADGEVDVEETSVRQTRRLTVEGRQSDKRRQPTADEADAEVTARWMADKAMKGRRATKGRR